MNDFWLALIIGIGLGIILTLLGTDLRTNNVTSNKLIIPDIIITVSKGISDTTYIYIEQK